MRSYIFIAALIATINAKDHGDHSDHMGKDGHMDKSWEHSDFNGDWDNDMDHDKDHHGMRKNDWDDIECIFGACSSATGLSATAAALTLTMAALM